ncbi:hypothetical protein Pcaca05_42100 [Pectobacterium carotovorum subsp. carotovorum]|nr:hypothetical protein Pcaca05_42100 [Pectobacterium carotovorum subsp. carotovorum]
MTNIQGSICDPSAVCSKITLTISENITQLDYVYLAQVWGVGFSSILSLWLVSYTLGIIVRAVKNT